MARDGVTVVVISSSSSSEDEEEAYERSQKSKLRKSYRLLKCPGRKCVIREEEEDDDDCVILEKDPFGEGDAEVAQTVADFPASSPCLCAAGKTPKAALFGGKVQQHQEGEEEEESDVSIVAERGKVALRDYPHSRHLCGKLPFSKTPHEEYCDQCYCYVCDKPAPCGQWKDMPRGHCNATDQDELWKKLRKANRSGPSSQKVGL